MLPRPIIKNNSILINDKEPVMPAYEYKCGDCQNDFLIFLSLKEFDEKPVIRCPQCNSGNVKRVITGFFAKTSKKS